MKRRSVYLLTSVHNEHFYVGWTTDLQRRLDEHQNGQSRYTKSRGRWRLMGYEAYGSCEEAKQRERAFKHHPRMLSLFKKRMINHARRAAVGGQRQVVG